jgi:anti-anti-sigma factor
METQQLHRRLDVEEIGAVAVVRFREPHLRDQPVIRDMSRELYGFLERDLLRLLLDFAQVEYLSSGMIGPLLELRDRARAAGGDLAVFGLRPELAEVFALAGMDQEFDLYADRQQALASFTKARPWGGGTSHDTEY